MFLLSIYGADPVLAVASRSQELEEAAARTIARATDGDVEFGDHVPALITAHRDLAVRRLIPKYRRMDTAAWQSWGRQPVDPLRLVYATLPDCGTSGIAGSAVTFRALPGEMCLVRITVFSAGEAADAVASEIAAAYQRVGVVVRPPLSRFRCLNHSLEARVRWPWLQMEAKLVSLYWHPEYSASRQPAKKSA